MGNDQSNAPYARQATGRRSSGDTGERWPVIGITTYAEQARWGAWDLPAALLPLGYVQAVADETVSLCSYHHQGVDRVAGALRAVGFAPDGAVEALEHDALPFAVGVLWHPEAGEDGRIFRALVEAARERAPGP